MALAHLSERNCRVLYEIATSFRNKCLMDNQSLLFENSDVWSLENLEHLNAALIPDTGDRTFMEKLKDQLKSAGMQGIRLATEVLCIYFLFPSDISGKRKREVTGEVLSWTGNNGNLSSQIAQAFDVNIGSTGGQSYNSRRYDEMKFLIEFAIAWKHLSSAERQAAIADPWLFQERVDSVDGGESRQLRHILLHLLFPDFYERISSGNHKTRIAEAFKGLISEPTDNADKELYQIRKALEKLLPNQPLDFYWEPLEAAWRDDVDEENAVSLDVIKHKKQIVLHGPPGTGKTFRARELAERLIRSEALKKMGPAKYFQSEDRIKKAVEVGNKEGNIRKLQLHPSYSYEDFIRGLHVTNGTTEYRLGFLPNLINEMERVNQSERLPYVLILDELNRTDLSRMLGEGFSLLENRDEPISLPAHDNDGKSLTLRIPSDLFIIGTMNLIDQSVEQLDFALRRRFLWQECPFDSFALKKVLETKWNKQNVGVPWSAVEGDFDKLIAAAEALNEKICSSQLLGQLYQVGHTYFFDIIQFLCSELGSNPGRKKVYLWNAKNKPQNPIHQLWKLSLQPLLREYLAGIDAKTRDDELAELERVFLNPSVES